MPGTIRYWLNSFDKRTLYLLLVITVAGLLNIPSLIVYLGLILYLVFNPGSILIVLLLGFALNMGAPPLFPASDLVGRQILLLSAFVVALFSPKVHFRGEVISLTILLVVYLLLAGVFFSKMPMVSVLKGTALGALMLSVLSLTKILRFEATIKQFSTVLAYVLGTSLILFVLGMGFERNGAGFQGSLVHPQVMGSFAALASAWFLGRWFFLSTVTPVEKLLGMMSLLMLVGSQSRTGALGLLLGYVLMVIAAPIAGRPPGRFIPRASIVVAGVFVLSLGLAFGDLSTKIENFLQKGDEVNLALDDILVASRGDLMKDSMRNFREHPLFGIGLGVPSFYDSVLVEQFVVRFQGIPVSATVEKGFLPTAALEEIGLVGSLLALLLLFVVTMTILKHGEVWVIWIYLTAMLQNAGEAVLFSPGGKGLLIWLVIGFCYMSAKSNERSSQTVAREVGQQRALGSSSRY